MWDSLSCLRCSARHSLAILLDCSAPDGRRTAGVRERLQKRLQSYCVGVEACGLCCRSGKGGSGEGMYFLQPVGHPCLQSLLTFLTCSRNKEETKQSLCLEPPGAILPQSRVRLVWELLLIRSHAIKYLFFLFTWLTAFYLPDDILSLLLLLFEFFQILL